MAGPDVLMKTRQVASALGLSVSTIKRWVDSGQLRASRTVGRHRLIPLSEVLRFAREQGLPHANLELLVGPGVRRLEAIDERIRDDLATALREGRAHDVKTLIRSVHASGQGATALADHLIRPVMERIGRGWEVGALDVFHEHQATLLVARALNDLIGEMPRSPGESSPRALGAAPEGDPYVLPCLLGELVLRELGWDVRNLGANLPLASLANAVDQYRPDLAFLSVSHLVDEPRFLREYAAFYEASAARGTAVIVGGRGLDPGLRARLVYASFGDRMAHLAEFARRLAPESGAVATRRSRI